MSASGLRQGLLLAMPPSSDPNQSRAVVLVVRHDPSGSFGLVINQPSTVNASVLFDVTWRGAGADLLWLGGPVSPQQAWILHESIPASGTPALAITPQIALATTSGQLHTLALDPPHRVRVILGSLDWAPGQLAAAMLHGVVYSDADLALVFDTPAAALWDRLQSIGARPAATGLAAHLRRVLGRTAIPRATLRRK
jgi:putative transcriptional regulator